MASPSWVFPSILVIFMTSFAAFPSVSSESLNICTLQSASFLSDLMSQCPTSISPSLPIQVDGDLLERVLSSELQKEYTAVVFYASWCPFSQRVLPLLNDLSFMFPQMDHLLVEQSSATPRVLSRYGIHSLPSIVVANRTSRVKYHGSRTLLSLAKFYESITGLEPVLDFAEDQLTGLSSRKSSTFVSGERKNGRISLKEMTIREPYLSFAVLFLCLRVLMLKFPETLSYFKALVVSNMPHLNLDIFGEASQLLMHVLHMIDVRRAWRKLRRCKSSNIHVSLWTSSLASVSTRTR